MSFLPLTKEELIKRLSLVHFPPPQQEELLNLSLGLIQNRIAERLIEYVTQNHREDFSEVVESGGDHEVASWIRTHVPEIFRWLDEEVVWVKEKIIEKKV